ncbi:YdeI/OmpD-associated family protein [Paenibacillus sp. F411]|uniref:YdeI/OmpD-associated family protein n=1 Tax=Paenibacillus sp. F411 TaxID=2820239 RepID=UPI001AB0101C|nr:YdeI/OmpD-associated family protein [Paenibacillus sp. F411]MBO2945185.1 YdeI/OmpD-associated family protein [Paenibacillus sp. F411]
MAKTIIEKLNLHKYEHAAVLFTPEGEDSLASLTAADRALKPQVYDMIFAFCLDLRALQELVATVIDRDCIRKGGYLYAAYPKKGNRVYDSYIHRDTLFEGLGADPEGYIGSSTMKFSRMVGMNDVFTVVGFKNEGTKKARSSSKPSQSVADYIAMIPNIEQDLSGEPEALAFYQSLTPGYQRDWARYVYSAVQEGTRAKRREEMKSVLIQGFKSIELYRQNSR